MQIFSTKNKTGAVLSIIFIVAVWGSASTVTKVAVQDIPPYLFALLRNLVASVSLLAVYLAQKKKNEQRTALPVKNVVWMGLTGVTFFYIFFNLGIAYTSAAIGALIQGFIPVAIILLAVFFLKEKVRSLQIAGIFISMCGVVMIGFTGKIPDAPDSLLGNVLIVFAVLSWGAYTIISKSMSQYDPVYLTLTSTAIGTAGLIPATVIQLWGHSIPSISLNGWLAILYLGIFSSAVCYLLYNRILKILPAVQVGNFMNLDPVFGAVIAIIFLHDRISILQIVGAVLVLTGVGLTSKRKKESPNNNIS